RFHPPAAGSRFPVLVAGGSLAGVLSVTLALATGPSAPGPLRAAIPILIVLWVAAMTVLQAPSLALVGDVSQPELLPATVAPMVVATMLPLALWPLVQLVLERAGGPLVFVLGGVAGGGAAGGGAWGAGPGDPGAHRTRHGLSRGCLRRRLRARRQLGLRGSAGHPARSRHAGATPGARGFLVVLRHRLRDERRARPAPGEGGGGRRPHPLAPRELRARGRVRPVGARRLRRRRRRGADARPRRRPRAPLRLRPAGRLRRRLGRARRPVRRPLPGRGDGRQRGRPAPGSRQLAPGLDHRAAPAQQPASVA